MREQLYAVLSMLKTNKDRAEKAARVGNWQFWRTCDSRATMLRSEALTLIQKIHWREAVTHHLPKVLPFTDADHESLCGELYAEEHS